MGIFGVRWGGMSWACAVDRGLASAGRMEKSYWGGGESVQNDRGAASSPIVAP
jgi:hypothetical protein